jgi:hypothetical protein
MQIVICHSHVWQQSVLLVRNQPRLRHTVHIVVSTGPRELTETLPITDPPRSRHIVQTILCIYHVWQQSVLLVRNQPRSRHTAHIVVSTGLRQLTKILPPARNTTAQPGRSWPRHREAFLLLARSYRMKRMLRANLHYRGHRGRIIVRIVMVRRQEEGGELRLCSYLEQCDTIQRSDRHRGNRKHQIQSGNSRKIEGSGCKPVVLLKFFSCDRVS